MNNIINNSKIAFAIGTGRCGTKFLHKVVSMEPDIASVHERNPLNETFHRYCKWFQLPVDDEGFLFTKEQEIRGDLKGHKFSFEASAYLSLSIRDLFARFGSKFILLVRSPELVVNSYIQKGWYDKPIVWKNPQLGLGYQERKFFFFFLGRTVPRGNEFFQWNEMTRVGKLAWYWKTINECVLKQFEDIPKSYWRVEKLEELTFNRYIEMTEFLGFKSALTEDKFNSIARSRPNAMIQVPSIASWNNAEIDEFEREVADMAKRLGYEFKVKKLPIQKQKHITVKQKIDIKIRNWKNSLKSLLKNLIS